ncbi:hypothetical protein HAX54_049312 [Datura stramonium]|uniref:Uncharacterized protein n=1 Tax=Datura stramonium TaxID=4076 RepID=A0ABS8SV93_DATST|nr:hypothetical protein [Datura stramonium]
MKTVREVFGVARRFCLSAGAYKMEERKSDAATPALMEVKGRGLRFCGGARRLRRSPTLAFSSSFSCQRVLRRPGFSVRAVEASCKASSRASSINLLELDMVLGGRVWSLDGATCYLAVIFMIFQARVIDAKGVVGSIEILKESRKGILTKESSNERRRRGQCPYRKGFQTRVSLRMTQE